MDFVAIKNNSTPTKCPSGAKRPKQAKKKKISESAMCAQMHAIQEMVFAIKKM